MNFLSVSSGIEAASVAWGPLGWKAVAFSEIEPYPCHLLHFHYSAGRPHHMPSPDEAGLKPKDVKARRAAIKAVSKLPLIQHGATPANWGDMNNFKEWPDVSIDLLCGGTPCQSFSVAGLRRGLDDARGNLMLTFGGIAAKYRPRWLDWENVPGVLSSNEGRDFASFLGLLTGQVISVPKDGWANSGILAGIKDAYGIAWRVLDAQYFGVPQRRRRVFVVGYLGDWRAAAAVLFEQHSMSGHPAPSRKARQAVAGTLSSRTTGGGGLGTDFDLAGGLQAFGGNDTRGPIDVATARNACASASGRMDFESETFLVSQTLTGGNRRAGGYSHDDLPMVAHSLRGEGFDASEDGTGRGTPLVPVAVALRGREGGATIEMGDDLAFSLRASSGGGDKAHVLAFDTTQVTSVANRSNPKAGDPCHPLAAGAHPPAIAFSAGDHGNDAAFDVSPTMRKGGDGGGNQPAIAYSTKLHNTQSNQAGKVYEEYTAGLDSNSPPPALLTAMQVRRLTPRECERLQGFPDDYTLIPNLVLRDVAPEKLDRDYIKYLMRGGVRSYQECVNGAADGPRYKGLGNSWAIPNVRWLGRRIAAVDELIQESP